ncbi:dolichyl-P-Glc:Glc1Man(9)GlcNAc(2)-PP-dolichol alpha-1,3-glucosyltransferase [Rhodotorula paludigena]|uniref:dolichyl-P-Glc:Glc1Man(9)GlcNAc(2)-PP-dolichol alpha-1,3-glucosyltransferase n=1 Tax=Rhodotorula paludigena TaxID=86838 RepID=UPI003171D701
MARTIVATAPPFTVANVRHRHFCFYIPNRYMVMCLAILGAAGYALRGIESTIRLFSEATVNGWQIWVNVASIVLWFSLVVICMFGFAGAMSQKFLWVDRFYDLLWWHLWGNVILGVWLLVVLATPHSKATGTLVCFALKKLAEERPDIEVTPDTVASIGQACYSATRIGLVILDVCWAIAILVQLALVLVVGHYLDELADRQAAAAYGVDIESGTPPYRFVDVAEEPVTMQKSTRRPFDQAMSAAPSSTASRRSKPPLYEPVAPRALRWYQLDRAERDVLVVSLVAKLLLFPAYRSTDFEVHRNWLAITHSLPLTQWYHDATSEWTLDYPPFFAYFERLLSAFAYVVDPAIVKLDNLGYAAGTAVAFQRSTAIASELVLVLALFRWARTSHRPDRSTAFVVATSVVLHPGLLIVDHIHFQYNGFLLGILLWSLIAARDNHLYACAALFATLLNFKHIFVYLALPYFVFLLRQHCYPPGGKFQVDRVVELGLVVGTVCAASFGPFLLAGGPSQIRQILSRLFPFQRGLNHAYWAANVWALVSAVDRVLVKYLVARGWPIATEALTSSSRGLIGATTFGVLPNVTPRHCFAITFGTTAIFLVKLWSDPSYKRFLDSVVLAAMTSFLFGWHVHEKAVLLFLIPLSLTASDDDNHFRAFVIATTAGVFGLFPLLIKPAETPIKLIFSLAWAVVVLPQLRRVVYRPLPNLFSVLVDKAEALYLFGFVAVQIYISFLHSLLFPSAPPASALPALPACSPASLLNGSCIEPAAVAQAMTVSETSMEFLPLLLTSVYCAVGIVWSWLRLSWGFLTS